ncbi:MAG: hypothetical protein L6R41_002622 [Letrouitia leprolyta]|nr:MAG: hypothetical protein L6R41_002622 [Letrouitia leprolyta]
MHELLLHASIPSSRHNQVLSILSGIAAMQPQRFHERHMIYKPTRPATRPPTQVGGTQAVQKNPMQTLQGTMQGDLYFLHLVEDLAGEGGREADEDNERDRDVVLNGAEGGEAVVDETRKLPSSTKTYTLQFNDIPEPGNLRPVTSRLTASIPITGGDASAFMSAMEYTQTSTHDLIGHTLTHLSTRILLFQPCLASPSTTTTTTISTPHNSQNPHFPIPSSSSPNPQPNSQLTSPSPNSQEKRTPTTKKQPLKPLDPSTHILTLSLLLSDGTKPELKSRGVKELMSLKEMLRGCVELEVVERGGLDFRVR